MTAELLIRVTMTVVVIAGFWLQYPRFVRKLEESVRQEDRSLGPKELAERTRNGRIALGAAYLALIVVAWITPLPF